MSLDQPTALHRRRLPRSRTAVVVLFALLGLVLSGCGDPDDGDGGGGGYVAQALAGTAAR